jgi:thioredoxin 1
MSKVVEVSASNFDELLTQNKLVILDFWAEWCGPCKNFSPVFHEQAQRHPEILFGSINVEEQQDLAQEFDIRSIPFLMILKENTLIYGEAGALSAAEFEELIQKALLADTSQ